MADLPTIEGLRDYDVKLLKVLGEHAVAVDYYSRFILQRDMEQRGQPLGLTSDRISESLSLFQNHRLMEEHSLNFQLTSRGFELYLKAFDPSFSKSSDLVQRCIVLDKCKVDKEISSKTGVCISTTRFLMQRLQASQLLILSESNEGYEVYRLTPRLERAVQESQERQKHIHSEPLRLFYSYSHKDEPHRIELQKHLSALKRSGVISEWHDRNITAGSDWKGKIDENLASADVVLLLVSSDFIDSDYCYAIEMTKALDRHKNGDCLVIPVILRPCDWMGTPLSKIQALPKDAKPITKWDNVDEAFLDVVVGLKCSIQAWREKHETTN